MPPVNIAVLASGNGSNLQALLDGLKAGDAGRVTLVISNKPDARALDRARGAGIAAQTVPPDGQDAGAITTLLHSHAISLVVLAGWLKHLPPAVIAAVQGRVINVHPALLPAFGGPGMYGHRVHEAVLQSGARLSGATVHLVDDQYDHGAILAQWPVPVLAGDTADTLAARVLAIEHRLLPAVVRAVCRNLAGEERPRPLAVAAEAWVLSDLPEADLDHALVPA